VTHNRDHIVIHSLSDTVEFGEPAPASARPRKLKVWHLVLVLLLVGFLAGVAI
jgi:hypothetical protein